MIDYNKLKILSYQFYKLANEDSSEDTLSGFEVELKDFDKEDEDEDKQLKIVKKGLSLFKDKSSSLMPILLKDMPLIVIDFKEKKLHGEHFLPRDGGAKITIYASRLAEFKGREANRFAHAIAHEMAHHVWALNLTTEEKNFWINETSKDKIGMTLESILSVWPEGVLLKDLGQHLKDKTLALQIQAYAEFAEIDDGPSDDDNLSSARDRFKELLKTVKGKVPVPANPITGYAHKDPEEAFCEAIGVLIDHGPSGLNEAVKLRLKHVLKDKINI